MPHDFRNFHVHQEVLDGLKKTACDAVDQILAEAGHEALSREAKTAQLMAFWLSHTSSADHIREKLRALGAFEGLDR